MWDDYHVFLFAPLADQTATRWVIGDVMLIFVYLLDDLILGFLFQQLDIGNR